MGKIFTNYKNQPMILYFQIISSERIVLISTFIHVHRLLEPLFQFFLQGIFQCFAQYKDQMRYGASLLSLEGTETKRYQKQKY